MDYDKIFYALGISIIITESFELISILREQHELNSLKKFVYSIKEEEIKFDKEVKDLYDIQMKKIKPKIVKNLVYIILGFVLIYLGGII